MKTARNAVEDDTVIEGGGNVFADLGLPDAAGELARARIKFIAVDGPTPGSVGRGTAAAGS